MEILTQTAPIVPLTTFEPLLNPQEAGGLLGIHAKTLLKMARANEVPGIRIGKHWRFRASLLNTYIADRLQSSGQPAVS
jgi:excisionase family DNA binding protein